MGTIEKRLESVCDTGSQNPYSSLNTVSLSLQMTKWSPLSSLIGQSKESERVISGEYHTERVIPRVVPSSGLKGYLQIRFQLSHNDLAIISFAIRLVADWMLCLQDDREIEKQRSLQKWKQKSNAINWFSSDPHIVDRAKNRMARQTKIASFVCISLLAVSKTPSSR